MRALAIIAAMAAFAAAKPRPRPPAPAACRCPAPKPAPKRERIADPDLRRYMDAYETWQAIERDIFARYRIDDARGERFDTTTGEIERIPPRKGR